MKFSFKKLPYWRLEVATMPLMFHFFHTERREVILNKGGELEVQTCKQKCRHMWQNRQK
jgi:hypothetical protein